MKQHIVAGLPAALMTSGLVAAAPPASAGCLDPGWAAHPLAQMCDSPVDTDGLWERCLTYRDGGPLTPTEVDCNTMSAGNPPAGDPIWGTPPTHIDP